MNSFMLEEEAENITHLKLDFSFLNVERMLENLWMIGLKIFSEFNT